MLLSVSLFLLLLHAVSGTQTKHLPAVLQPPNAEQVVLPMKGLGVFLPPGRLPGSVL